MKNATLYSLFLVGLLILGALFMHCKKVSEQNRYQPKQSALVPTVITNASQDAEVVVTAEDLAKARRDAILAAQGFDTNGGHKVFVKYQSSRTTNK